MKATIALVGFILTAAAANAVVDEKPVDISAFHHEDAPYGRRPSYGHQPEWPAPQDGYNPGGNSGGVILSAKLYQSVPASQNRPDVFHSRQDVCRSGVQPMCQCSDGGLRVTCHNVKISSLRTDFPCPHNIQYLTLRNPRFIGNRRLSGSDLQELRSLRSLTITGSNLDAIAGDAFQGFQYLEDLTLADNQQLRCVEDGAFSGVVGHSLQSLDLSNNHLMGPNFSPNTFANLRRLRRLSLRGTGLTELHARMIEPLSQCLVDLDISRNQLQTLATDLIPFFCRLSKINLGDNPWCCARNSRWLSLYLRIVNERQPGKVTGSQPTCSSPREFRTWTVHELAPETMDQHSRCDSSVLPEDPKSCGELYTIFRQHLPHLPQRPEEKWITIGRGTEQHRATYNRTHFQESYVRDLDIGGNQHQHHREHHRPALLGDTDRNRGSFDSDRYGGSGNSGHSNRNTCWASNEDSFFEHHRRGYNLTCEQFVAIISGIVLAVVIASAIVVILFARRYGRRRRSTTLNTR